jgi:hypothetical protein
MNQHTNGIAAHKISDNKWQLLPFQIWKPSYLVCGWGQEEYVLAFGKHKGGRLPGSAWDHLVWVLDLG